MCDHLSLNNAKQLHYTPPLNKSQFRRCLKSLIILQIILSLATDITCHHCHLVQLSTAAIDPSTIQILLPWLGISGN